MVKNLLKLFPVLLILLLVAVKAQAQTRSWLPLGPDDVNNQVSSGAVNFTNIVTDPNGVPYVAFSDGANSWKITVKKYEGGNWITVGTAGFSTGTANYISLAFNGSTPYVTYMDFGNNLKATVMMFDGSNWVMVGTSGISEGMATSENIAFNGNIPYILYDDHSNPDNIPRATVKKFDGTNWVNIGTEDLLIGGRDDLSLAFYDGTPYIAYNDKNYSGRLTVKKNDGSAWVAVGSAGVATNTGANPSIVFNGGTPYIAYSDGINSGKATVRKFDGSNWILVGAGSFSTGSADHVSLAFNGSTPFTAYRDSNTGKATVKKFDGSNWTIVGTDGFSIGSATYTSLAFSGNTPYITYRDDGDNGNAEVKKFDGANWVSVLSTGIGASTSTVSLAFNGNTPYVAYADSNNGGKVSVKKHDGSNWVNVGTSAFAAPFLNYFSLDISSDGTPYIVYTDLNNGSKATVKKFDGNIWVTVGTAGFTSNSVAYPSIKVNNGVPYIVYQNGAYSNGGVGAVMKFDGTNWINVGSSFADYINYPSLAFNGNTPYVIYSDGLLSAAFLSQAGSTVKKFDGTSWATVGSPRFSGIPIMNPSVTFDSNTPYVAYTSAIDGSETFKKFDGKTWITVATAGFLSTTSGSSSAISTAFIGSIPYMAYKDGSNGSKATVSKYDGSNWIKVGTSSVSSNEASPGSLMFNNNKLYLAYASHGAFVKYYNLPSSINAQLSNLTISKGFLSPEFSSDTTSYTVNVSNADSTITITPTLAFATASVKVNGVVVASGTASAAMPLNIGNNTIAAVATAQDGTTTQTYTLTVNRAKASQTITFASLPTKMLGDGDFTLAATSSSGLPVAYTNSNLAVATVNSSGTVHIVSSGTTNITASQAGDAKYLSAADVIQSLTINTTSQPPTQTQSWLPLGPDDNNQAFPGAVNYTNIANSSDGIPYVVSSDASNSGKLTVKKFVGGNWITVGVPAFSSATTGIPSIAVDGSIPYVSYADSDSGGKTTVMKFDGSNWITVGPPGFLTGSTGGFLFAFNQGVPYITGSSTVMKFNGTNWITVGTSIPGSIYSIGFNSNVLYVAYRDNSFYNRATVSKLFGSDWTIVGTPAYLGNVGFLSVVFYGGTFYAAYSDSNNNYKASVKRFDGSTWVLLGNLNISTNTTAYISIASNGTPYVAYEDGGKDGKATVKRFNGIFWEAVGVEGFSEGPAEYTAIALSGNTPFVAFQDNTTHKASVMMFDGTNWAIAGSEGSVSDGTASYTSLASNNNTLYMSYEDGGLGGKASVKKFNGSEWVPVGTTGFSAGQVYYTSLAFNGNTPYVAYVDVANSSKATVKMFDGNNWLTVGLAGFSTGSVYSTSLAFNGATPYIAYTDVVGRNSKVTVMKFDGSSWVNVGAASFSAGQASYTSLAFNAGVPYVVFSDGSNNYKATVMKFDGSSWIVVGTAGFSAGQAGYTSLFFNDNTPYVAYQDSPTGNKATVMKFDGVNWVNVGVAGFSKSSVSSVSLTFVGSTPYISYADTDNGNQTSVMKFDGSNWVTVGNPGFSASPVNSTSIVGNNNNIYVAYSSTNGAYVKYYSLPPVLSSNAQLSNLAISSSTLTPAFSSDSVSYTAGVDNSVNSITLTPTLSDATASVKVNGIAVTSGAASAAIPLKIGSNTITAIVTAQDGTTTQTYTLTVNRAKASQTITFATLPAKTYGDADFTPGATSDSNVIPVTYNSSNPIVATVVGDKIHIVGAGTTSITVSQASDSSFLAATDVTQILSVNKASLTITADNQNKAYGSANPVLTVTYNGFVSKDDPDSLTTKPTVSTTATATSAPGTYPITVEGAASANYNITYVNGTLTIGQSSQTIVFDVLPAKAYGDADFTLSAKSSSGLPITYSSTNPAVAAVSAAGIVHILSAGTVDIKASQAGDGDYGGTSVTQTLTVNKASLTITANNQTKTYGSANPDLTISYSGFVNGDAQSVLTARPTTSTTATTTSDAGTYAITINGAASANYTIAYIPGTLNVTQASQTITFATLPAKAYGDADFTPGATSSSGLPLSYSSSNPGVLSVVNGKLHTVAPGTATITSSQSGNINYLAASPVMQNVQVVFTLPSNNFTISATAESCKGSSNGEININAVSTQNYTATVVSAGVNATYPFTGKLSVKSLPAGTYSVCITIADYPAFKQCFDVTVTEPKDLSVYAVVNPSSASLNLNLAGASSYNINLNGTNYTTTQSTISLPVSAGKNILRVTTASICQGIFEKTLELPLRITAYPNPFENTLSLSIANDHSSTAMAEVYNMQGKMVYSGKTSVNQGTCSFDMANLSPGNYILKLILEHSETNIKIIKK